MSNSLDAVEVEYGSHVLGQRHRVGPGEVICDRNDVLLPSQGGDDLLQPGPGNIFILLYSYIFILDVWLNGPNIHRAVRPIKQSDGFLSCQPVHILFLREVTSPFFVFPNVVWIKVYEKFPVFDCWILNVKVVFPNNFCISCVLTVSQSHWFNKIMSSFITFYDITYIYRGHFLPSCLSF